MPGTAIDDGYTHYDHSFPLNMNRYVHLFPANPYGTPPQLPVQQSVAHKVWIIDCRSCGSFLTNRGMKVSLFPNSPNSWILIIFQAVLLLRPNVPLYSCDALPQNCSAFTHSVDDLKPPSESRSCNCLSQTLSCVGCGTTVGYMIVIPVRIQIVAQWFVLICSQVCSLHLINLRKQPRDQWPSVCLSFQRGGGHGTSLRPWRAWRYPLWISSSSHVASAIIARTLATDTSSRCGGFVTCITILGFPSSDQLFVAISFPSSASRAQVFSRTSSSVTSTLRSISCSGIR